MKNRRIRPGAGRLLLALMSVGLWSLAGPQVAAAQPGWSGVITNVSQQGQGSSAPDVAFDAEGNAVAVWAQHEDDGGGLWAAQAARFTLATGTWTAPSILYRPNDPMWRDGVYGAKVAMDAVGNALVVWRRDDGATGHTVETARYSAAQGTWSPPHSLSVQQATDWPVVAMDAAGDGIVLWSTSSGVQAAHYAAATDSWGAPIEWTTTVGPPSNLGLVMDSAGDAVAVFTLGGIVHASHYRASTGAWSIPTPVSTAGDTATSVRLAADDQGHALAAWVTSLSAVHAARFVKATGTWTAPVPLSQGGSAYPNVAVDCSGNAFVTWLWATAAEERIEAIRYSAAGDSWGSVVTLATGRRLGHDGAPIAVDAAGNAIALWGGTDVLVFTSALQFARYVAATGAWSPAANVPGGPISWWRNPSVGFDAGGNAVALWTQRFSAGITRPQATRWVAGTPAAPTIMGVAPGPGSLAVHVAVPAVPAFPATNLEYSLDGGRTWTARIPASTTSPVVIDGLTDFSVYTLRVRGSNAAGVGVPSPAMAATAGPVPGPPLGLTTTAIAGNTATISWTPPPAGATPATGYVLEGGVFPGQVLASIPTGSLAPTFTFVAPTGAFFIRVHAVSGAVHSAPSNEIRIFVEVPAGPSAPTNLLGLVNGSSLTLSWTNTFGGGPSASLWLKVTGTLTTGLPLRVPVLPLPMGDTFGYDGVPPGTYTLSVAASNASGVSPFSNPVTLTFPAPCSGVPWVPVNFQAWRIGTTIFVSWSPPTTGPAVTSYTVQVSGAYVGSFTTGGRTLSGVAVPGSYVLSVAAGNACGMGPATPTQMVVIP